MWWQAHVTPPFGGLRKEEDRKFQVLSYRFCQINKQINAIQIIHTYENVKIKPSIIYILMLKNKEIVQLKTLLKKKQHP